MLAPVGGEAAAVAARHPGARVFAVAGTYDDCRRLELELGGLFPWGFVSGNLHPYASEGAKTISFEIAEQLGWQLPDAVVCPAASGTLFSKLAQGFAEVTRAGLAAEPVPRMFAAQALGSSPIAAAFADDRGISRVEAVDRRSRRSPSATPRTAISRSAPRARPAARIVAVAEDVIEANTALLAETTGIEADCASGAALGALAEARRAAVRSQPARASSWSSPAPGRNRWRATWPGSRRSLPMQTPSSPPSASAPSIVGMTSARPRGDTAAPLRRDVRVLGTILGTVLVEQEGEWLLELVERDPPRRAQRAARQHDREHGVVARPPSEQALVLRAFGLYFQLANLAEQHHRLRRRREDAHDGVVARESLDDAFRQLAAVRPTSSSRAPPRRRFGSC